MQGEQKTRTNQQNNMNEIWKNIIGFEGFYQISNLGRIRSLPRYRNTKSRKYTKKKSSERILKPIIKKTGYVQNTLTDKNRKQHRVLLHIITAKHFIENSDGKPQVNHINGIKNDNRVENLEWCTTSENGLHSYRVLGRQAWIKGRTGRKHPTSRPVIQRTLDGKFIKKWECALDAVRQCGFDSGSINRACNGVSKHHKGFKWEYAKL